MVPWAYLRWYLERKPEKVILEWGRSGLLYAEGEEREREEAEEANDRGDHSGSRRAGRAMGEELECLSETAGREGG